MPLIENDRYPKNDRTRVSVTSGDIRTLAGAIRELRINASHTQPQVRALEADTLTDMTDIVTRSGTQTITGDKTFSGAVAATGAFSVDATSAPTFELDDAATNTQSTVHTIRHNTSGTPTTNYGMALRQQMESSTTESRNAFLTNIYWTTATDASRTARVDFRPYDATTSRVALSLASSGTAPLVSVYGATPVARAAALTAANAGAINSGDATTDAVIGNMRTRIAELETAIKNFGITL